MLGRSTAKAIADVVEPPGQNPIMIDLNQSTGDIATPANEGPSAYYPSIRFDAKQLKALGLEDCELGEPYEMTIRVKATNISEDGTGFDIVSADKATEAEDGEAPDDEEAEKPKMKAKRATVAPGKGRILKPPVEDDEE